MEQSMLRSNEKNCLLLKTCCLTRHCHFTMLVFEDLRVPYLGHAAMPLQCRDTSLFHVLVPSELRAYRLFPRFSNIFSVSSCEVLGLPGDPALASFAPPSKDLLALTPRSKT